MIDEATITMFHEELDRPNIFMQVPGLPERGEFGGMGYSFILSIKKLGMRVLRLIS